MKINKYLHTKHGKNTRTQNRTRTHTHIMNCTHNANKKHTHTGTHTHTHNLQTDSTCILQQKTVYMYNSPHLLPQYI